MVAIESGATYARIYWDRGLNDAWKRLKTGKKKPSKPTIGHPSRPQATN